MAIQSVATSTIDLTDPRSLKAMSIAEGAGQWLLARSADGQKAYGIPSSSGGGRYYITTFSSCDCPDFQRHQQSCKHVLAVRIHCARVRATEQQREHQRSSRRQRRPAQPVTPEIAAKAQRYDEIFARFEGD